MTDRTAFAAKLNALIADDAVFADGGARVISQGGAPSVLAAILAEVDNTVLERTLVFGMGAVTVSAVVAGRRMRGIVDIDADVAGASDIVGQVLSRDEPDLLENTGALLTALGDAAGVVTVRSTPVQSLGSSGDAGISATGLAEIWDVDMDATPAPPMERFLAANADKLVGLIHINAGKIAEQGGESDVLKAMWEEQIPEFRKRFKALHPKHDGPMLICLDDAIEGELGAALALVDDEACMMSYKPGDLAAIIGSWTAITA